VKVTLCDAGPLLAIIDPRQGPSHSRCVDQLNAFRGILLTTWPCIAEAMHIADKIGGRLLQRALWHLLNNDVFQIASLTKSDGNRMDELMEHYRNVPMW
jgi:uncharacterized protein